MTYNKEELLNMLSTAPLYEGIEFHEGRNDEFFNCINNFHRYYSYAYGATKLALIPIKEEKDYVIKIPYTGGYNYESSYRDNSIYYPTKTEYWEYTAAENKDRPWDYCACEVKRYKIAKKQGLSKCFAKTKLLGYINDYPIYIQEKCTTLSSCRLEHRHTKEENLKTSNYCNNYFEISMDWLTDFRLYYGKHILLKFVNFIQNLGWDDDLKTNNIGYIKNRPVLIDYSGFLD